MSNEQQQSAAVRKANLRFRQETKAKEGSAAWAEYGAQETATRQKTAKLREQRLARDAATAAVAKPPTMVAASRRRSRRVM